MPGSFLCTKHFFLMKVIFIQGAFKNIQGLLWKIQYPTIFQFSRTFQGHNAFSRTFQDPCEPCKKTLDSCKSQSPGCMSLKLGSLKNSDS